MGGDSADGHGFQFFHEQISYMGLVAEPMAAPLGIFNVIGYKTEWEAYIYISDVILR